MPDIQPGVPQVVKFQWDYPPTMPGDYTQNLLVVVVAPDDPNNPSQETRLDVAAVVKDRKWAALKPLDIARAPVVDAASGPLTGLIAGGTKVVLKGQAFTGASVTLVLGLLKGALPIIGPSAPPAASDTEVWVMMPPWPQPMAVTLQLETPAGPATPLTYTYT